MILYQEVIEQNGKYPALPRPGPIWHGTGNYHSHTEKYNQQYRQKVKGFHDWIKSVIALKQQQ